MNRSWELTDLELVVLWERLHKEPLPAPLTYTSSTPLAVDFEHEKERTWVQLRARFDGTLDTVLGWLARPDVRVQVRGIDPRAPELPTGIVRMLGARMPHGAAVIRQIPGETAWHSGGFMVTACEPEVLVRHLIAALPEQPAGRRPDVLLVRDAEQTDVDHWYGRSAAHDNFHEVERRCRAFLRHPACSTGTITVLQGHSLFGPRGITRHRVLWRDLVDDGRYAVQELTPPAAVGVDGRRLASILDGEMAKVVQTLEDEEHA